jgi:hypothetical protein
VRNFGFVSDINPASAEKTRALLLEALRIGVCPVVHAEQSRCLIIDNVSFLYEESPRKTPFAGQAPYSSVRVLALGHSASERREIRVHNDVNRLQSLSG